jgi:hypothetical protein
VPHSRPGFGLGWGSFQSSNYPTKPKEGLEWGTAAVADEESLGEHQIRQHRTIPADLFRAIERPVSTRKHLRL